MQTQTDSHKHIPPFQIVMLALSIYVLCALAAQVLMNLSPDVSSLLQKVDTGVCIIFLADFFIRLYQAPSKAQFMKWGWIDLLSSIPTLDVFRWGRLVRVVRILRILRGVRSARVILSVLLQSGLTGTFSFVALVSMVLVIFSSITILHAEASPDANIRTAGDALWWSIVTITTVGYGDKFPVTAEGRIIAAILMVAGVGLFGTFTASVASLLLRSRSQPDTAQPELLKEIQMLHHKLDRLESQLTKQEVRLPAQFGPVG